MLELDPGMMVWTWITFFIVLFILSKIALKPLLGVVENREKEISDNLDKARKEREESEALVEKHRKMIEEAESEGQKILKENQKLAENARQEILDKANQESDKMIEKAKEEIVRQKAGALAELKAEVADLAVGAAEKIIEQNLDKDKQKSIVENYIKNMSKTINN
ncbi:MAG: F0F1 ATP synthase subunit B [Caldithrix sp.]|nr:F0F1 ATP synthase subunit B [Caldithrix sp.]